MESTLTQRTEWTWLSTERRFLRILKETSANVETINGIQIWRNQHGLSRLVAKKDGKLYTSSVSWMTIQEAKNAISNMNS
jgi:hypothetical protein